MIGVVPKGSLQETFAALLKEFKAHNDVRWEEVLKTLSNSAVPGTATAFQPFNLDMVGKLLLPQITPLQNMGAYAVKSGESGDSREYRAIVAKNVSKSGGAAPATTSAVSTTDTGRAKLIDYTFLTRKKAFAKIAPEAAITWELYRSSGPFNALGKQTIASLITAKELEERHVLGDDATALGTGGTTAGTASTTGGSLATATYTIAAIPVNYWGWWYWSDAPAADLPNVAGRTKTEAIPTASAGIAVTGPTGSIAGTVPSKKGAYGYVWTIQLGAGAIQFAGFTTIPSFTFINTGTFVVTLPTVDGSLRDMDDLPVIMDGLFAQIARDPDIPGEYTSLNGALTATAAGSGVTQLETMFQALRTKWFVSPDMLIMSPNTQKAVSAVAIGSGAPAYRLMIEASGGGEVKAGTILSSVRNQYAGREVEVVNEPLLPDGKIIGYTKNIDYPDANVATNLELHCTDHFLQIYYALITDVAPPGPWSIKTYGAPVLHWPRSCGVLDDINVA